MAVPPLARLHRAVDQVVRPPELEQHVAAGLVGQGVLLLHPGRREDLEAAGVHPALVA